jgi:hypothetical protein
MLGGFLIFNLIISGIGLKGVWRGLRGRIKGGFRGKCPVRFFAIISESGPRKYSRAAKPAPDQVENLCHQVLGGLVNYPG